MVSKRFNLRGKISGRDVLILSGKLLVWKRSGKETAGKDAFYTENYRQGSVLSWKSLVRKKFNFQGKTGKFHGVPDRPYNFCTYFCLIDFAAKNLVCA